MSGPTFRRACRCAPSCIDTSRGFPVCALCGAALYKIRTIEEARRAKTLARLVLGAVAAFGGAEATDAETAGLDAATGLLRYAHGVHVEGPR